MDVYNEEFYRVRYEQTKVAASIILDRLLSIIPMPVSAIDVGCGVGTWLSVLKEKGVVNILGIEGSWVNRHYLVIESSEFLEANLEEGIPIDKKFDLAISLEVAEHLSSSVADQFVKNLTELSDYILFSAAPPFQGGSNHINEQPIDYWREKFECQGYISLDFIRPYIWNDQRIGAWYRQNVIFLVNHTKLNKIKHFSESSPANFYMHPDIFMGKLIESQTVKGAWKLFRRAIRRKIRSLMKW